MTRRDAVRGRLFGNVGPRRMLSSAGAMDRLPSSGGAILYASAGVRFHHATRP